MEYNKEKKKGVQLPKSRTPTLDVAKFLILYFDVLLIMHRIKILE